MYLSQIREMSERQLSAKLRSAINAGDEKAVQRLLKGGVDVNATFWVILCWHCFRVLRKDRTG